MCDEKHLQESLIKEELDSAAIKKLNEKGVRHSNKARAIAMTELGNAKASKNLL